MAIIRISGPGAREILSRAFSPAPRRDRVLTYGHVMDAGRAIDEAMAVFLPAPHTYTREDVAEIHCHGGRYITRRVLALVLSLGARAANPGEFTLRAFLHGRVTLDEAEPLSMMVPDLVAEARNTILGVPPMLMVRGALPLPVKVPLMARARPLAVLWAAEMLDCRAARLDWVALFASSPASAASIFWKSVLKSVRRKSSSGTHWWS